MLCGCVSDSTCWEPQARNTLHCPLLEVGHHGPQGEQKPYVVGKQRQPNMLTASPAFVSTAEPEAVSYSSLKCDSDSWLPCRTQVVGRRPTRKLRVCYFGELMFMEENHQEANFFSLNQNPGEDNIPCLWNS